MSPSFPISYTSLPLPEIRVEHHPASSAAVTPIVIVSLHRPKYHHAFTDTMGESLIEAFGMLSRDERVKVVILTSSPQPSSKSTASIFCAGADLSPSSSALSYEDESPEEHRDLGGRVALAIHNCNKPVIAAINGHAVGVGITMTLPCSIRVVSNRAKIGFVFARRGIVMEGCSSYFLPRLIGFSQAMHLITTGSVYPATHPLFSSLFTTIVPPEEVFSRAIQLGTEIVENCSIVSLTLMRDMMYRGPPTPEAAHLLESSVLAEIGTGRDKREGVASFIEGRKAVFRGTMEEDGPGCWPWWNVVDGVGKGGLGEKEWTEGKRGRSKL
jgi:enoyl-CoA hydratase/carnithine racemase